MVDLHFVSISHPDDIKKRETRKKIGQHVMKNIGYSRRKKASRKIADEADVKPGRRSNKDNGEYAEALRKASKLDKHDRIDPEYDFKKSPITALSRNYAARAARLESLLTRADSPMCRRQRELYFTLAMLEDGAFQLALADAALFEVGEPVGRFNLVKENPWAMRHYTACISIINQNIGKMQSLSQDFLGIIIGLAAYDLTIRNFDRWATHMKGLENMIRSRGGLKSLNSAYIMDTMLWIDMCGSLNIDARPHFTISGSAARCEESDSDRISAAPPPTALSKIVRLLGSQLPVATKLIQSLESLSQLAEVTSAIPSTEWITPGNLLEDISSNGHFVLNVPRRGETPGQEDEGALYEAIRLASLLFMNGIVCCLSDEKDLNLEQVGRLPTLLTSETIDWTGMFELELWVYFVGARIEEGEGREWLVSSICQRMRESKLGPGELDSILRGIAWVDEASKTETHLLKAEIRDVLERK